MAFVPTKREETDTAVKDNKRDPVHMATEIRFVDNPTEVRRLASATQIVEARLAKEIYDTFNAGEAVRNLQKVAKAIMQQMYDGPDHAFANSIRDEGNLRLWARLTKSKSGFSRVLRRPVLFRRLDASDCADLIRLAGAWVEKGGIDDPTIKEAFRAGGPIGAEDEGLTIRTRQFGKKARMPFGIKTQSPAPVSARVDGSSRIISYRTCATSARPSQAWAVREASAVRTASVPAEPAAC